MHGHAVVASNSSTTQPRDRRRFSDSDVAEGRLENIPL